MSGFSIEWLADTLIWTAALIALVLILRRPVARHFGPQMAYALWALPVVRLFLPPIELPAWLAPEPQVVAATPVGETVFLIIEPAASTMAQPAATQSPWPILEIVIGMWLVGVCAFLYLRFQGYFAMRRELLEDAREVGRAGKVRLIETPGTSAPLAFGVRDKVVALPTGFMASPDREARDLAVAHELAHHRGHDLLVNVISQPLFALHWFNPLGYVGWLALRRDQEAACDARVMAEKRPEQKATYASVIASFAAGPNVALAAPMACPVLGDKSIIHRLRSLQMNDLSSRRRGIGRGLLIAAMVVVPLTASVSYAETVAPVSLAVPVAPTPPAAPAAPIAPGAPGGVMVAPLAPEPPLPPAAPLPFVFQAGTADDGEKKIVKKVKIVHSDEHDGEHKIRKVRKVHLDGSGEELSDEEIEEIMVEVREGLAEADVALEEAHVELIKLKGEHGEGGHTKIELNCEGDDVATHSEREDGTKVVMICKSKIMAHALHGLKEARAQIAQQSDLAENLRAEILKELDLQIERWAEKES